MNELELFDGLRHLVDQARPVDLDEVTHRRPVPGHRRLVVALAAVAVLVLVAGAIALLRIDGDDTAPITTDPPPTTVPTTTTVPAGPVRYVRGEDIELYGFGTAPGTLDLDVEEQGGEVTGELRVNDVVVTMQCLDIVGDEIRLGGVVTDDPGGAGFATIDDPHVTDGDLVALIIREEPGRRDQATFYTQARARSCTQLVGGIRNFLDAGFFMDVAFGDDFETGIEGEESPTTTTTAPPDFGPSTIARADRVELAGDILPGVGAFGGGVLTISVGRDADGVVTGELRIDDIVVRVECADISLDGLLILAGPVTADPSFSVSREGLLVLAIQEGEPDRVSLSGSGVGSCDEFIQAVPNESFTDGPLAYVEVVGGDIETG